MDDVKVEINGQHFGKIVPRFHFKDWNMDCYQQFVKSSEEQKLLSKTMVDLTKYYYIDNNKTVLIYYYYY